MLTDAGLGIGADDDQRVDDRVAPVVEDYLRDEVPSLAGYQRVLEREILPEVAASHALMEVFHLYPPPFVWALQHSNRVWRRCARLVRGDDLQPPGLGGLYPAGEGAGHAGGIVSSAMDGLRVADAICRELSP